MNHFKIKDVFKKSKLLIQRDFFTYVAIVMIIESLALFLINQVSSRVFSLALISAKMKGITNENFLQVFSHPTAIFLLLSVAIISAIFIVLQLTITTSYANGGYTKEPLNLKRALAPLKRIKVKEILLLLIFVFVISPNGNLSISSEITSNLHLPRFIVDTILENTLYSTLYFSAIAISFYLNLRLYYAFVIFSLEPLSFTESLKKSWKITKHQQLRILGLIGTITISSVVGVLVIFALAYLPYVGLAAIWPYLDRLFNSVMQVFFLFGTIIFISFVAILSIQVAVVSYHELNNEEPFEITKKHHSLKYRIAFNTITLLAFCAAVFAAYYDQPDPTLLGNVKIVAHRGESFAAIENTMESLRLANEYKPDFVEMDIQQTKDHQIVVYHDYTLKRLSDQSDRINALTWDELKDVEISHRGHTSTIPLFDDYLALAAELNQPLMVEVKTTSLDSPEFLDDMMALIKKNKMEHRVIFQSLDLDAILLLKEKYPSATTGYILGFNLGGLENINVDFFSIEDFSISSRVMRDVHKYNKGLFVWTVNDEDNMRLYLQSDVTGIITDHAATAKDIFKDLRERRLSDIFWNFSFD